MTVVPFTPIKGYTEQSENKLSLVNLNKEMEERVLRRIDALWERQDVDRRYLALAKSNLEIAMMCMNRAIMRPNRVELPEDHPRLPLNNDAEGDGA